MMKTRLLAALVVLLLSMAATAQMATFKGKATDREGKPIAGATILLQNLETGRKVELKTDKNGNYFSIAVPSGKYRIALIQEGKEVFSLNNVPVSLSVAENVVDFNLQKEAAAASGAGGGAPTDPSQITEEQKKRLTPEQQKQLAEFEKEKEQIKNLNTTLAQARDAQKNNDFATAENLLKQAVQVAPERELLWFNLGEAQSGAAKQETDRAAKKQKFEEAAVSYKKSLDLLAVSTDERIKPFAGDFYNNYAKALEGAGKGNEAVAAYDQAAKASPQNAGMYYFNQGAILTNANRTDEAVAAFDKAIAADPNKAEAYYWKGVALMGKATTGKDGKFTAPEGTDAMFNKYLELQPDGPLAQPAKDMLTAIGSEVKTTYRPRDAKKKSDKKN